jgi:hypothetical protein
MKLTLAQLGTGAMGLLFCTKLALANTVVGVCTVSLVQESGLQVNKTIKLEVKAVGVPGFPYLAEEELLADYGTGEPLIFSVSRTGRGVTTRIFTPHGQSYPPRDPTFKLSSISTDGFVVIDHVDLSSPYLTQVKVYCRR